jgi:hypothetical protein
MAAHAAVYVLKDAATRDWSFPAVTAFWSERSTILVR